MDGSQKKRREREVFNEITIIGDGIISCRMQEKAWYQIQVIISFCPRSGSLEVEPKTQIYVQVIHLGNIKESKRKKIRKKSNML